MVYEPRTYRNIVAPEGLATFEVVLRETDLQIAAKSDLSASAVQLVQAARTQLEDYIAGHPHFAETFSPYAVEEDAPRLVKAMAKAAWVANVGPMAAVAGAVAEFVARGLASRSSEVIVENGGDVYLIGARDRTLALWAGEGVRGVGIEIAGRSLPAAVCTSSGRFGHSTSLGSADAVAVVGSDGAITDAVATALANRVHGAADIERALEAASHIQGVRGVIVNADGHIGAWGDVHLVPLGS
ncbi:MAG: hypothetical protein CVT60_01555 [Actinobacteria bacterium HGW-Actinobacteria-10]|jgi:hypothetical protein|nr:MAG: hypothetical protein CVT60_01555 [Actinobacteria bacterium HGW-Actinobacteria-10]